MKERENITLRSLLIGAFFVVFFSFITVYFENRKDTCLVATQISPAPFLLLFVMVFLLNPLCRLLRVVRRFTVTEVLIVFIMGSVSAGIPTFGLAAQLVPVIGNLFNGHWNTDQSEWNLYVEPFVNEAFFISEEGIRPAARQYRAALLELRTLQQAQDAAFNCRRTQERENAAASALAQARQRGGPARIAQAEAVLEAARRAHADAQTRWKRLQQQHALPDIPEVVATFPDKILLKTEDMRAKKAALRALEQKAFEKVALFRRGLKDGLRAYPGFVPLPGETFTTYVDRLRRLRDGTRACSHLRRAESILADSADTGTAAAEIRAAATLLQPLDRTAQFNAHKAAMSAAAHTANEEIVRIQAELAEKREARRFAAAADLGRWEDQIHALETRRERLNAELRQLRRDRELTQKELDISARVSIAGADLENLAETLERGVPVSESESLRKKLADVSAGLPAIDASWRRFLVGDIPWSHWLKPTLFWLLVMGLTYTVLMSFNVLIFRQWAYNERLIYPLAEVPQILAGNTPEDSPGNWVPVICRDPLFWGGFGVAAGVMGWNLLCYSNAVPGLKPLDLSNSWYQYTRNTPFRGLTYSGNCKVFFTCIGLAFMVPANISFSIWFFYVLYMVQLLIMVWAGYGVSEGSFPSGWWHTFNFRSAEGSGAMIVFAIVVLFKCRKYLLCCFSPGSVSALERPEQTELRISSFCFVFGSLGLVVSLWLGLGANLFWTMFVYLVMMVITIGIIRGVAEGGILSLQAHVSPFHLIRHLFGMDRKWTSPSLFAPLMVFYAILFLDLKTFIAPAMANALKMRDDARMKRGRFHLAIFVAIAFAVIASIVFHIVMGYDQGADCMRRWFHTSYPRIVFDQVCNTAKTTPVDTAGGRAWLGVGAALMAALLFLRRFFFWMPHPIGLIMITNPLMRGHWFSIFLAWIAKRVVTKYGNKDTYKRVRRFFIGLIIGELFIVILAVIVSYALDTSIRLNLNR